MIPLWLMRSEKKEICVFRWHISRIAAAANLEERDVHVTITSETKKFRRSIRRRSPEGIGEVQEDRLEWWHGDKYQFEGYTTEKTLLNAYFKQNVFGDREPSIRSLEERGLEEDMVLLQFVDDCSQAFFDKDYMRLKAQWDDDKFPDVSSLAKIKRAVWLDFTVAARRMAKTLYQKVSGTQDEPSEEDNASKR